MPLRPLSALPRPSRAPRAPAQPELAPPPPPPLPRILLAPQSLATQPEEQSPPRRMAPRLRWSLLPKRLPARAPQAARCGISKSTLPASRWVRNGLVPDGSPAPDASPVPTPQSPALPVSPPLHCAAHDPVSAPRGHRDVLRDGGVHASAGRHRPLAFLRPKPAFLLPPRLRLRSRPLRVPRPPQ